MTNKLVILGIAILAIGLVALPETLALFSNQHDWYDVITTPSQLSPSVGVPCSKCHADVYSQMLNAAEGSPHRGTGSVQGTAGFLYCEECHIISQIMPTIDGGKGLTVGENGAVHAAAAPQCLDCHGDGAGLGYRYGTAAPDATSIFKGSVEAHTEFVNASNDTAAMLAGANEACVGCHTHVQVDITWRKPTILSLDANTSSGGAWEVGNFQVSGQNVIKTTGPANGSAGSIVP